MGHCLFTLQAVSRTPATSVSVCFVWYKVFNWIDGKLKKASNGNAEPEKFDTTPLNMGKPSSETIKEVKLGANLAALAGFSGEGYGGQVCLSAIIFSYSQKKTYENTWGCSFPINRPINSVSDNVVKYLLLHHQTP
jgi:hypothetical protein